MYKLFELKVSILDDTTYSDEELVEVVTEAIEIHVEAKGVDVVLEKSSVVIATEHEMAEA